MKTKKDKQKSEGVSFYGHETFPFRYAWFRKGVNGLKNNPTFFQSQRSMAELGVGRNMVTAIRYWCLAAQLIKTDDNAPRQSGKLLPTEIGKRVFFDVGLDPYIQDAGTLWVLHWLISTNLRHATTWFWMFNHWNEVEFTKDEAAMRIQLWLADNGFRSVAENSLKRDIDCFVRTYTRSRIAKNDVLEDTLNCPLIDLSLITELNDGKTYQFQRGEHLSLPDAVFAFAIIDFWDRVNGLRESLELQQIAYGTGSPGRVFKLSEDTLTHRLEQLETVTKGAYFFDETSGLKQVYQRSKISSIEILVDYYKGK